MSTEVKLPPKVQAVLDEIERIKKKISTLQKLGGDTDATETLLKEAMDGILGELASEARYEIIALQEAAIRLNQGIRPPMPDPNARNPDIEPNEDIVRLEEFEEERKRIQEKLKHAKRHAPPGEDTDLEERLEESLEQMDARIRRAARAAARREIDELRKDIEDLRRGKPKRDHGKGPGAKPPDKGNQGQGPDDPDDPDDPDSGNNSGSGSGGGGSGGGSGSIDAGIQPGEAVGKRKEGNKEPTIPTIFVRSDTRVFAWDARFLKWNPMDFEVELISVKKLENGILAFSDKKAALYDSYLGYWLPALEVPDGGLTEGES